MSYECLMDIEKNYAAMFKYDFSKGIDNMNEHYKKVSWINYNLLIFKSKEKN